MLSRALRPQTLRNSFHIASKTTTTPLKPSISTQRSFPSLFQQRFLSELTRTAISKAVGTSPVVLFMKGTPELPQCGFSRTSIQILGLQGLNPAKFTAFNVLEDEELRSGIKEFSDWPTIPQLYVDGEFVGGCDILMSMHKDGSLAALLGEKGLVVEEEDGSEEVQGTR